MPHERAGLLARARYWQRRTAAVLFDVPLATVEAQNASRDRVVPAHVVRELHGPTPTPRADRPAQGALDATLTARGSGRSQPAVFTLVALATSHVLGIAAESPLHAADASALFMAPAWTGWLVRVV